MQGAKKFKLALMCAEKDPLDCHRTVLVCRELLREADCEIGHVLADESIEAHSEAEERMMKSLNILPDLWRSRDQCLDEAYEEQGKRIAYVDPDVTNTLPSKA
jgi:hypothetical protein